MPAYRSFRDNSRIESNPTSTGGLYVNPTVRPSDANTVDQTVFTGYFGAVLALNPVAYWRLGEASGSIARPVVGPEGAYVASPTLGAAGALASDTADTAVTFNGTTQYITVPDSNVLDLGDGPLSYAIWWKKASDVDQRLFSKGTNSPYLFYDATTDRFDAGAVGVGSAVEATAAGQISDSNWHFIVFTKDTSDVWKLYVDGVDRTGTSAAVSTASTASQLVIGARDDFTGKVNGSLDEVALFASVLSSSDVATLYAAASANQLVTPDTATLVTATFAPTVLTPRLVTPGIATLTTATFAPTVLTPVLVTPATATLTTATFAPTVATPRLVTPSTATLTTATFAPTVSTPVSVVPSIATLTLSTFAPTVTATANQLVTPSTATLTTATFAPTVAATAHVTVVPDTASLTLTPEAPSVTVGDAVEVQPGSASLTLTTFEPVVTASDHQTVTPATASLTLSTFAPTATVSGSQQVTPDTASLTLLTFAPSVVATGAVEPPSPPHGAALVTGRAEPRIIRKKPVKLAPRPARLRLQTYAPTVTLNDDEYALLLLLDAA